MQRGDTVVDIGAHIGLFSLYAQGKGAARIFAFEPNPMSFDAMMRNISLNRARNIRAFKVAVLSGTTSIIFHIPTSKFKDRSSLFEIVEEDHDDIYVDCISLDDFVERNELTNIDFLKLDAEGAEHKILADSNSLSIVEKIAVEAHDIAGHRKEEVAEQLFRSGFRTKVDAAPTDGPTIYVYGRR